MLYRARVIQNNTFLTNGFIWVRIDQRINQGGNPDLSINPESDSAYGSCKDRWDENLINYADGGCYKCYVYSPFGGGDGYGMFTVPQINAKGIVSQLDYDNVSYVWLGALFEKESGNIPLPEDDGIVNPVSNGQKATTFTENERKIKNLNNALVISMKHTELADPLKANESKDKLDWTKRPVENLLVISQDGVMIQHNILEEDESKGTLLFEMDANGISMDYNNEQQLGRLMVVVDENKKPRIEISAIDADESGTKVAQISGNSKKMELLITDGDVNKQQLISMNSEESQPLLQLINGTSLNVTLQGNAISLKAPTVTIDSEKINLGGGGRAIVTAPSNFMPIMGVDVLSASAVATA